MKKNKGFSLIEVLIALGIMGVASVALMSISKLTAKNQKRAEVLQNVLSLENQIQFLMTNPQACQNSLNAVAGTIINNKEINIVRANGTVLFTKNQTYFNNSISITDISIVENNDYGPIDAATLRKAGTIDIVVSYNRISPTLETPDQAYTKSIGPIVVEVDGATDQLWRCQSDLNTSVEAAMNQICSDVGGIFDAVLQRCVEPVGAPNPSVSNPGILDSRYVDVVGDTMTGPLVLNDTLTSNGTITSNAPVNINAPLNANGVINSAQGIFIAANQPFCIGTQCIDFQAQCPNNQYQDGYDPVSGAIVCKPIPSAVCGPGEFVVSVTDGTATCGIIPEAGQGVCPQGEYLTGYNVDGTKNCQAGLAPDQGCTPPEVLQGFNAAGEPICTTPAASSNPNFEVETHNANGDISNYDYCYISRVSFETRRGRRSSLNCRAVRAGSNWRLEEGGSQMRRVNCEMTCMNICNAPENGYWSTTSSGSCNCPSGSTSGTQSVTQECVGTKCGGICDPTQRVTSRNCYCPPPCNFPNMICPEFGGACVPRTSCPSGGGFSP